jgi:2,4-dienoyl-CoA reductase-like NADH-dependent reductase (Old Yellow Enzyme family)
MEESPLNVSPLARPVDIGHVRLRNRLLMAPLTTNYGDERGAVTEKTLSFYEERARGGAGALIFEAVSINPRSRLVVRQHGLHDDSFLPGLREVTRRVHADGAPIFVQLCHGGPKAGSAINGVQPVSASDVPVKVADIPRAITREEISGAIEDFASAALRAREAGFDGVELHAAHFYLLSAFLSGYLNRRSDEYGGSVGNRARLACQVIAAVKSRAGEDFPVICRINGREALPGGIDEGEAQEISRLLEGAGADALHISAAMFPVNPKLAASFAIQVGGPPSKEVPSGCYLAYALAVKQALRVPVIAVGKLNEPSVAEGVVRDGIADVVAVGRGLIADPYLPEKVLTGRWDAIVRCEDCLLCHTTLQTQRDVNCSVNPRPWEPRGGAR